MQPIPGSPPLLWVAALGGREPAGVRRACAPMRSLFLTDQRPLNAMNDTMTTARPTRKRDASNFDDYLMLALTIAFIAALVML